MKKAILSSLCSAFVIPGLGQIINHEIKKGALLLSAVFILFVGGCIKLAFLINTVVTSASSMDGDPQSFLRAIQEENLGSLWILGALFAVIWVYSVIDAFVSGLRLEAKKPP
jgi:TM2 domain-containing membrane protein YozV